VPSGKAWEEYWQRAHEAAAHRGGGPQEAVLERFWSSFFSEAFSRLRGARVLDVACGNGALTRLALEAARQSPGTFAFVVAVDRSPAALHDLGKRFASVPRLLSDARRFPFPDGSFDIVASQFGLEYAGVEAVEEAARVLAPRGALAAVLHLTGGSIYRECAVNLEAMRAVRESGILPLTAEYFRAGKSAERDPGLVNAFRAEEVRFAAAVRAVDEVLVRHGEAVAGGTVYRMYADVARMYGNARAYDAQDVADWCVNMAAEVEAYSQRMSSMLGAAIDAGLMEHLAARLAARGLAVRLREPLLMGVGVQEPAAWALVCERP
jgi:ubiquinone/menaquinone biosynthesis C-methylase UbiE